MNNPSFSSWEIGANGLLYDYSENKYPTKLYAWDRDNSFVQGHDRKTYFGYVYEGNATIMTIQGAFTLGSGMYFSLNKDFNILGGRGIVIERVGEKGINMLGGAIEKIGRLNYIDGCTDSLLIPPVLKGYSCLNHLHFPEKIDQTMHTHPSMRVGMVAKGSGNCITPFGEIELFTGQIFIIHEKTGKKSKGKDGFLYLDGSHCFQTFDKTMEVIAFHPDRDFGPEHEEHPMINRTIVDGVSAKNLKEIQSDVIK